MDADVDALVRAQRLVEAARLADAHGDAATASALYERACEWSLASQQAVRAGDLGRAMELAARAGNEALGLAIVAQLQARPTDAVLVARRLARGGHPRWAAQLFEGAGLLEDAAAAWSRSDQAGRAADLQERAGKPEEAARTLEAALRKTPEAWSLAVSLGALLSRFGRNDAAARVLQRVPPSAPERRDALTLLVPALERLDLTRALDEAGQELRALGGPTELRAGTPAAPRERARLFGRYELVREVASSPCARVLECVDAVRGDRVAVKLFAPWGAGGHGRDAIDRFEREVKAMRALVHPHVVPLREYLPGGPAIVMAWMAGGSLDRLLATTGSLPPARAADIADAVLSALGEAHRLGIVHRDVKPANVLFDGAGQAHVADFGVAHLGDLSTTATAGVFGSLATMSPEQRAGRPATARSDVFSVGVLLGEMLGGALGPEHDALLARWTAPDPLQRPPDALAARAELRALAWPVEAGLHARMARSGPRASAHPAATRLRHGPGDLRVDGWTGRGIEVVALTEVALARASAQARAAHPALQTVLRVDRATQAIWLEPLGPRLAGSLSREHRARLAAALAALHAAGGVHGHVDADHVSVDGSRATLRFAADADPSATPERDRLALAHL